MSEGTAVGAGCTVLELAEHSDERGELAVLEEGAGLPFKPARVFVVSGVPHGVDRGSHGHHTTHEVLIAVAGQVTVDVHDGHESATVLLDSPRRGLHIPAGVWARQRDFTAGAVLVVLASTTYSPNDYFDAAHGGVD